MTDVADSADRLDDDMDDYEAGFIDGVLAAQGIEDPTAEELAEAMGVMERFVARHADDPKPS